MEPSAEEDQIQQGHVMQWLSKTQNNACATPPYGDLTLQQGSLGCGLSPECRDKYGSSADLSPSRGSDEHREGRHSPIRGATVWRRSGVALADREFLRTSGWTPINSPAHSGRDWYRPGSPKPPYLRNISPTGEYRQIDRSRRILPLRSSPIHNNPKNQPCHNLPPNIKPATQAKTEAELQKMSQKIEVLQQQTSFQLKYGKDSIPTIGHCPSHLTSFDDASRIVSGSSLPHRPRLPGPATMDSTSVWVTSADQSVPYTSHMFSNGHAVLFSSIKKEKAGNIVSSSLSRPQHSFSFEQPDLQELQNNFVRRWSIFHHASPYQDTSKAEDIQYAANISDGPTGQELARQFREDANRWWNIVVAPSARTTPA